MRSTGVKACWVSGRPGRGWRRILSLILITILIASCDGDVLTGTPATLRFGYDYWPGYYPALIAAEKGYFAKEGLIVKATKCDDTDALFADFGAGEYDAIGASLGDIVNLTLVHPAPNTISLEGIRLTNLWENIQLFKAGETMRSTYYTARLYINFFLGSGGLTRKPDVEHILKPRFLDQARGIN